MKHAYLILAHHEFDILMRLVKALDDERNDIYIHFDKKADPIPEIVTAHSNVYILSNRIDVKWGDVSQIESELLLFQEAVHGSYAYYHLLSGVDMPLKSQDYIHRFFALHSGKEFIGYCQKDECPEIDRRVKQYHLFPRHFRATKGVLGFIRTALRYLFLRIQYILGIRRNSSTVFKKGTNWVSVSQEFVVYLLQHKEEILKNYQHTYCADEIFLQTLCWYSPFRKKLFDANDESHGCMRLVGWKNSQIKDWEEKDYDLLISSEALFARKFNSKHLKVVDRLLYKTLSNA